MGKVHIVISEMEINCRAALLLAMVYAAVVSGTGNAQDTIFPAIISFGDSSVDVGNNNHRPTYFKANYPPYGKDYMNHKPTGRFCNGKLLKLWDLRGMHLHILVEKQQEETCFLEPTLRQLHPDAIPLSKQLEYFKAYQKKLEKVAGGVKSREIIRDALLNKVYTPHQYSSYLVSVFAGFVKKLYSLGARRVGVTSLLPLGCVPEARNFVKYSHQGCVSSINNVALQFNKKINLTTETLQEQLPGLKIVVLNIFEPLYDLIRSPAKYGFVETRRGCCATAGRRSGTMSVLCNPKSRRSCANATEYVFWDNVHPTEAANQYNMNTCNKMALVLLAVVFAFVAGTHAQDTLVPAIITFGDSAVDVGNNDYLPTLFKANYPPYGRDFVNHKPTGRFCNGKLATDITAETLGFKTYPPAYLSPEASGKNLLIGANFASAASGYDDKAAIVNHAIPLTQQLQYFKEYKGKLAKVAGSNKSDTIIKGALYLLSAGSSDFVQNYYVNPYLNKVYTADQYGSYLVGAFTTFIKGLYGLGARKIGVTSLPPLGCLPAARTLFGYHESGCVSRLNTDAQQFNKKINAAASSLQKQLPGSTIVIFDIFKPLYDLVQSPSSQGFKEARRGCCGTGTVETTSLLCNPKSPGTCPNATQYVFWDSVHPSQAANQVLADALIVQGISLIG
ncbi:hypothetical protein Tsubulata_013221 [Turnera subulata]|uniref:GDSL esterase/lipase APG n=1 Tax=Turnera subulata TaxID=218843 RepID=A0A9Q0FKY5_9ROSI|nr:hypothetical protein Tsubulata_013221 [Turnera subulata]